MFDEVGSHLYIPTPPAMLSAAGSSQSLTTKRHLENLSRASSYVQFEKPASRTPSGRMERQSITSSASTPQRTPREPLVLKYAPTSSLETLALTLEMQSKIAKRTLENEEIQERALEDAKNAGKKAADRTLHSDISGVGRERHLCSSPRGQLSEADRRRVLDNIETSHHFAQCLVSQSQRIQETLSPLRDRGSPRVTLDLTSRGQADGALDEGENGGSQKPLTSPRQSSCFASHTARFSSAHGGGGGDHMSSHIPPVGHYTARYTIVERSSRSASLRDGRNPAPSKNILSKSVIEEGHEEQHASTPRRRMQAADEASTTPGSPLVADESAASRDFSQQPRYASPRRGIAPNSARERTRQKLAGVASNKIRPTSAFASTIPQLHFHTMHMKMHTQRESEDDDYDPYGSTLTAPRHNDTSLSTTPRVQGAAFQTMKGRNGEAFHIPSAAPEDVLVYQEDVPYSYRKVPGSVEFVAQSNRKWPLHKNGQTTSVDDANLRVSDRMVASRVISVPAFDRGAQRNHGNAHVIPTNRDRDIPTTVAVELIPDRRDLFKAVDKDERAPDLKKLGKHEGLASAAESGAVLIVTTEPFTENIAQTYPRQARVDFQMHSSHQDAASFAKVPEKRLAQGDFPSTGQMDAPGLDSVRPKVIKNIDIKAMTSRDDHAARAVRDAEAATNRPVLEAPDSPLRYSRVTGNPHIASGTTRDQRSKKGRVQFPKSLDKFYDVSYATNSHKVKLVSSFATQVTRTASRKGNRTIVQTQVNDNFPGPGSYF